MEVGNFLPRDLPVGKEEVHSFALKGAPLGGRDALRDEDEAAGSHGIQLTEALHMCEWCDQGVARMDGLDIHEGRADLITMHERAV